MILSCSSISLPCLSSSVIIRFFPRLCVLLTFFKLLDASIVSRISSKLCFRISSFAFFFMVLHISTYYMWSLGVLFSIIYLRFFVRALVQISYRIYNSYHWSSISLSNITKENNEKIHNAIREVSKRDCIIMGDFNHGNIKWDTL